MLHGREAECALLDDVVRAVRAGTSAAVVLVGDAGIGKTALLHRAAQAAPDLRVLRAAGVEAETELPFATLHQLLGPVLHLIPALPPPQAAALGAAVGLTDAAGHDRFLVAAGVLSLLGEAAGDRGLLCLVDDAQWADPASADALVFAARRLSAEGVAVLFAVRGSTTRRLDVPKLRRIELGGLARESVAALIEDVSGTTPPDAVVDGLVEVTAGNPLAVRELTRPLTPEQVAGRAPLPDLLPLSDDLERAFLGQVRGLASPARSAVLVAALDTTGQLEVVTRAGERLGEPEDALHEAEARSLLRIDGTGVRFRHPLIRSAVVAGASVSQRRAANRALADAVREAGDPDRAAWHRAAAATAPDDASADELEGAAARAARRAAHAVAASGHERAAVLTSDGNRAARRFVEAARSAWLAAVPQQAYAALDAAAPRMSDPVVRAEAAHVRGLLEWRRGSSAEAHRILLAGAGPAARVAPGTALAMLVLAQEAAGYVGDVEGLAAAGAVAETVDPGEDRDAVLHELVAVGFGHVVTGRVDSGVALLRAATERAGQVEDPRQLTVLCHAAASYGDQVTAAQLAERAVRVARSGHLSIWLPHASEYCVYADCARGHLAAAAALATEGLDLARATQQDSSVAVLLANLALVAAIRGDDDACLDLAAECRAVAEPRRIGLAAGLAAHALALSDLAHGRYAHALQELGRLARAGPGSVNPSTVRDSLADRVEAAVRCGDAAEVDDALDQLTRLVAVGSAPELRSQLARSRALTAGPDADELFREAGELLEATPLPLQTARTHLLHGEWLRRQRRRVDARVHLRLALEIFERLGARPWEARARAELRATGETARKRAPSTTDQLTPRELQIVRIVRDGATNRDVAAQLFLSPRTVDYHLRKVFVKLGLASRAELFRLDVGDGAPTGTRSAVAAG